MTSHELVKLLLEGPDLMVTRRGYEGGVEEITEVFPADPIHLFAHQGQPYMGTHAYHVENWCSYYDENYDDEGEHPIPDTLAIHLS